MKMVFGNREGGQFSLSKNNLMMKGVQMELQYLCRV